MKSVKITRKVDELGRIVIPAEIRKHLGVEQDTVLEVELRGEEIVLRVAEDSCRLCGSKDRLHAVGKIFICHDCAEDIKKNII